MLALYSSTSSGMLVEENEMGVKNVDLFYCNISVNHSTDWEIEDVKCVISTWASVRHKQKWGDGPQCVRGRGNRGQN